MISILTDLSTKNKNTLKTINNETQRNYFDNIPQFLIKILVLTFTHIICLS